MFFCIFKLQVTDKKKKKERIYVYVIIEQKLTLIMPLDLASEN